MKLDITCIQGGMLEFKRTGDLSGESPVQPARYQKELDRKN